MATIDKIQVNGAVYDIGGADGGRKANSTNTTSKLYLIGAKTQGEEVETYSSKNIQIANQNLYAYSSYTGENDSYVGLNGGQQRV